jgi:hypothetical protein
MAPENDGAFRMWGRKDVVDDLWVPAIIQDKSNARWGKGPVTCVTPLELLWNQREDVCAWDGPERAVDRFGTGGAVWGHFAGSGDGL